MSLYALKETWRLRHLFCEDTPPPIDDPDEARYVRTTHAGHGPHCRQYLVALRSAPAVIE